MVDFIWTQEDKQRVEARKQARYKSGWKHTSEAKLKMKKENRKKHD
jgi:hypothetical protein